MTSPNVQSDFLDAKHHRLLKHFCLSVTVKANMIWWNQTEQLTFKFKTLTGFVLFSETRQKITGQSPLHKRCKWGGQKKYINCHQGKDSITNWQGEKSSSRPTGIGDRFVLRTQGTSTGDTSSNHYTKGLFADLKKKTVYNRNTRNVDTKLMYRGRTTIEATRTIIDNVPVYNYISSIDVFIKIANKNYKRFISN